MPSHPGMWVGFCHAEYYANYERRAYGKEPSNTVLPLVDIWLTIQAGINNAL